jgi:hypothetical protein
MVLVLGLGSRFLIGLRGHNFDFESFIIVGEIIPLCAKIQLGYER